MLIFRSFHEARQYGAAKYLQSSVGVLVAPNPAIGGPPLRCLLERSDPYEAMDGYRYAAKLQVVQNA